MSRIVDEWRDGKSDVPIGVEQFALWYQSQIKIGDRMADEIERLERLWKDKAALIDALRELGVDVMLVARADGKCPKCGQSIGSTTYCVFCGEHLVALPKPPKE